MIQYYLFTYVVHFANLLYDGCIIARSNEAKQLGIKMGQPFHEIENILKRNKIAVFSTNFRLYGDMSRRIMQIMSSFVPEYEIYSIDYHNLNIIKS